MNQQHYQLSLGGQLNILGCRPGVCAFSTYVTYVGSTLLKRAAAIDAVRDALKLYRLEAPYQPRVALGSKGFEAIPRLRCKNGLPIPEAANRHAMDDIDVARQAGELTIWTTYRNTVQQ